MKNDSSMAKFCNRDMWLYNPILGLMIGVILFLLILFLAISTSNTFKEGMLIGQPVPTRDTITITGKGSVMAVPDIAQIQAGVLEENKDLITARDNASQKINNIQAAIKAFGIDAKDIQTSDYSIYPTYDYLDRGRELTGYQVRHNISVKIRDLEKIGEVLAKVTELGANQVGGIQFTIDDPESLKQTARQDALTNAKEKAAALAAESNTTLGNIVSFTDSDVVPTYPGPIYAVGKGGAADNMVADIEPGQQKIEVSVTVTYELVD